MIHFHALLSLFRQEFTFRKSWYFNLSWIIAFGYFLILQGDPGTEIAFRSSIAMLISLAGMLGLGSIPFQAFGAQRRVFKSRNHKLIIGTLYTIVLFFPWFYLPIDAANGSLLFIECGILFGAAVLGLGDKEKSIVSILLSLFAKRIFPLLIVIWTFYLVGNRSYESIFLLGGLSVLWQLIAGFRGEIKESSRNIKALFLGLEILSFSGLAWLLSSNLSYQWIILVAALLGITFFLLIDKTPKKALPIAEKFLDTFYSDWLSYFFLISIIFIKTEVTFLFIVHLVFMRNALKTFILKFIDWLKNSKLRVLLFNFTNYRRGLILHLTVLLIYTALFCVAYKLMESYYLNDEEFFYKQGLLSKFLVLTLFFHGFLLITLSKKMVVQTFKNFLLEAGSPYNLAIFRIIMFQIILGSFFGEVFQYFEQWTHLPDSERTALPFIGWLIEILPITPELYRIVSFIGLGLAISILLGFKTRIALILYIPVALYLWGVPNFYGKLNHRHIMVWVPIILAFSRCADVLSIDAYINRKRKKIPTIRKSVEYALPFKMIWITLGIIYCSSGLHKLWDTGLFWALSDNLKNQIQLEWIEQYDTIKSFRIDHFPVLLNIGGMGIILLEIIYPILILKSYTRTFAFLGAWFLHLSAGYFLFIDFFHLRIANLSLLNWMKGKNWIRKKITGIESSTSSAETFSLSRLKRLPIVYVGGGLIAMNLLFSIFEINSWPFSGYPSYSNIVPNKVTLLEMNATDASGKEINVKRIGKNAHFRWESIRPFEERIAELAASNDTTGLQNKLNSYWALWATKVDSLESIKLVEMSLVTTGLAPERRGMILDSVYLGAVLIDE